MHSASSRSQIKGVSLGLPLVLKYYWRHNASNPQTKVRIYAFGKVEHVKIEIAAHLQEHSITQTVRVITINVLWMTLQANVWIRRFAADFRCRISAIHLI